jgi:hypothetical protein
VIAEHLHDRSLVISRHLWAAILHLLDLIGEPANYRLVRDFISVIIKNTQPSGPKE